MAARKYHGTRAITNYDYDDNNNIINFYETSSMNPIHIKTIQENVNFPTHHIFFYNQLNN